MVAWKIRPTINKWDLIKLTSFCTAKETVKSMNKWVTHKMEEKLLPGIHPTVSYYLDYVKEKNF